jgi:hypothetical protein
MPVCDGCGQMADTEHIRKRIQRLEMATRYRPVHVQTLLIGTAPPEAAEEYLYASEKQGMELQKNGIFVVYAVECPLAQGASASEAVQQAAPVLIKRLQFSYKPKAIVLFSPATTELLGPLRTAGFEDRLILKDGKVFDQLPDLGHAD